MESTGATGTRRQSRIPSRLDAHSGQNMGGSTQCYLNQSFIVQCIFGIKSNDAMLSDVLYPITSPSYPHHIPVIPGG